MSSKKIRVGFVGLGHNGIAHIQNHVELGKSEVVALCDQNRQRLEGAGAKFGVTALYQGDEIFADQSIDAISIHTGDDQHVEPFVRAMEAGKHVLVEKPLANSEEDVHEIVRARDSALPELKVQVGYILRFNPVYERLYQIAGEGGLGDLYYMEGDYIHNLLYQAKQSDAVTGRNWYLEEEIPLVGGGSHPLDILRWVSGKQIVRTWTYSTSVAFPEMASDDCQVALFQFEDGSIAKVAALYGPRCAMAPYYNIRFYGTRGTVDRDQIALSAGEDEMHPEFRPIEAERVQGHAYSPEIEDWLDSIIEDRQPRTPLHDGANSTLATLCAARAAREGRQVEVPVLRPR